MSEAPSPVFRADTSSDPVLVRVDGRATFQNSGCLREFIARMLALGKPRLVLDFAGCEGVDSTFLGVLAGAAIEIRRTAPEGSLVIVRAGARNLELMRNLGLHRLLTLDSSGGVVGLGNFDTALQVRRQSEAESARLVLEAHENLVAADEANRSKFQDVLAILRERSGPMPR
jgi:anti-anti-sigma regulatory factor